MENKYYFIFRGVVQRRRMVKASFSRQRDLNETIRITTRVLLSSPAL